MQWVQLCSLPSSTTIANIHFFTTKPPLIPSPRYLQPVKLSFAERKVDVGGFSSNVKYKDTEMKWKHTWRVNEETNTTYAQIKTRYYNCVVGVFVPKKSQEGRVTKWQDVGKSWIESTLDSCLLKCLSLVAFCIYLSSEKQERNQCGVWLGVSQAGHLEVATGRRCSYSAPWALLHSTMA